jgi:alanyl-tRNA synthetase
MRFDFAWNQGLSASTRSEIENIANNAITDNLDVVTRIMSLDDAKETGAMALFGEKYGESVRVVDIGGPWSRELCAGTHVARSSEVGLINLIGESSIGSTNRRIEALVGTAAFDSFAGERALVAELTSSLKSPKEQLPSRIAELIEQLKNAERTIAQYQAAVVRERIPALVAGASTVGTVTAVISSLGVVDSADALRQLVTDVRDRLGAVPGVVALGAEVDGKAAVIIAITADARSAGLSAGTLAKRAAAVLGGGGGGRDDVAQGGGSDPALITAALDDVRSALGD